MLRLLVRLTHRAPPLPAALPRLQTVVARGSHYFLYALMFAMPLIGWAMLSAAGTPVQLWPGTILPPILSHSLRLFGWLSWVHGLLGYGFFLLILGHLGAALFHGLIRRDGVLRSMASFGTRSDRARK